MTENTQTQIVLAGRPDGTPDASNFDRVERPIPTPDNNEVLVRTRFLSVDPYMRLRMAEGWAVGDVLTGGVVGKVVESHADDFAVGDIVTGSGHLQTLDWAEYTLAAPSDLRHVETGSAPISTALGVLGMPGRTAYFGMLDVGAPKPGDTVVVSGAAGAVGSVAGQLASLAGCRVVGIAGSAEKVDWITEGLGFDAAVNYRAVEDIGDSIDTACPDGVDVYFDNVGGTISEAILERLNSHARVAVCGQIAHYNDQEPSTGRRVLPMLRNARIEDFSVGTFGHRYHEANARLAEWVTDGAVSYRETVTTGLENAPAALIGLFEGENIGKQLVEVAEA